MKTRFNYTIVNVAVFIISLSISLVAVEIYLNRYFPAPLISPIRISHSGDYQLSGNRKLIYVPVPYSDSFNSDGQRGPEFPVERDGKKTRIIFLGDSVVQAMGMDLEERFTELLGKKLGSGYEIINMGVQGYNLTQEIEYFKLSGEKYKPDLVIFGITFNDLEIPGIEVEIFEKELANINTSYFYGRYDKFKKDMVLPFSRFNLYRYFYILTKLNKFGGSGANAHFKRSAYRKMNSEELRKLLMDFVKYSSIQKFRIAIVFLPVKIHSEQIELIKHEIEEDEYLKKYIRYMDINDTISDILGNDYQNGFYASRDDVCHFGQRGHVVVADLIFRNFKYLASGISSGMNKRPGTGN